MVSKKEVKKDVFAVHDWETSSGGHDVTVWDKKGKEETKTFEDWEDAEIYAQEQAKKMGNRDYLVDTPSRPHVVMRIPDIRWKLMKVV